MNIYEFVFPNVNMQPIEIHCKWALCNRLLSNKCEIEIEAYCLEINEWWWNYENDFMFFNRKIEKKNKIRFYFHFIFYLCCLLNRSIQHQHQQQRHTHKTDEMWSEFRIALCLCSTAHSISHLAVVVFIQTKAESRDAFVAHWSNSILLLLFFFFHTV